MLSAASQCLPGSAGEHEHHHREKEYSYMNIRMKEFPWGDCALFDGQCWKHEALAKSQESEE